MVYYERILIMQLNFGFWRISFYYHMVVTSVKGFESALVVKSAFFMIRKDACAGPNGTTR
jgi:hypothetical protein